MANWYFTGSRQTSYLTDKQEYPFDWRTIRLNGYNSSTIDGNNSFGGLNFFIENNILYGRYWNTGRKLDTIPDLLMLFSYKKYEIKKYDNNLKDVSKKNFFKWKLNFAQQNTFAQMSRIVEFEPNLNTIRYLTPSNIDFDNDDDFFLLNLSFRLFIREEIASTVYDNYSKAVFFTSENNPFVLINSIVFNFKIDPLIILYFCSSNSDYFKSLVFYLVFKTKFSINKKIENDEHFEIMFIKWMSLFKSKLVNFLNTNILLNNRELLAVFLYSIANKNFLKTLGLNSVEIFYSFKIRSLIKTVLFGKKIFSWNLEDSGSFDLTSDHFKAFYKESFVSREEFFQDFKHALIPSRFDGQTLKKKLNSISLRDNEIIINNGVRTDLNIINYFPSTPVVLINKNVCLQIEDNLYFQIYTNLDGIVVNFKYNIEKNKLSILKIPIADFDANSTVTIENVSVGEELFQLNDDTLNLNNKFTLQFETQLLLVPKISEQLNIKIGNSFFKNNNEIFISYNNPSKDFYQYFKELNLNTNVFTYEIENFYVYSSADNPYFTVFEKTIFLPTNNWFGVKGYNNSPVFDEMSSKCIVLTDLTEFKQFNGKNIFLSQNNFFNNLTKNNKVYITNKFKPIELSFDSILTKFVTQPGITEFFFDTNVVKANPHFFKYISAIDSSQNDVGDVRLKTIIKVETVNFLFDNEVDLNKLFMNNVYNLFKILPNYDEESDKNTSIELLTDKDTLKNSRIVLPESEVDLSFVEVDDNNVANFKKISKSLDLIRIRNVYLNIPPSVTKYVIVNNLCKRIELNRLTITSQTRQSYFSNDPYVTYLDTMASFELNVEILNLGIELNRNKKYKIKVNDTLFSIVTKEFVNRIFTTTTEQQYTKTVIDEIKQLNDQLRGFGEVDSLGELVDTEIFLPKENGEIITNCKFFRHMFGSNFVEHMIHFEQIKQTPNINFVDKNNSFRVSGVYKTHNVVKCNCVVLSCWLKNDEETLFLFDLKLFI